MSKNTNSAFEQSFYNLSKNSQPLEWTSVQGQLASKLTQLSFSACSLEKITSLKNELEECNQGKSQDDCVSICNELANGYHYYSQCEDIGGINYLNEALELYKKTLMTWTRQNAETEWSTTFNNIAMIFLALGERTQGKRSLEKSIAAFNNALTVYTRESSPVEWAICHNNMAVSLRILAELSQNIKMLKDSVECYEKALGVVSKERTPVGWVILTANLGDARLMLANQLSERKLAYTAIEDFRGVVEYFKSVEITEHQKLAEDYLTKAQNIVQHIGS